MSAEFLEEFGKLPVPAIKWAFHEWRRRSEFWPSIKAMSDLVGEWRERERDEKQNAEMVENRETRERLKAAGEPYGLEQTVGIMKQAVEQIKSMPEQPWLSEERRNELRERIQRLTSGKVPIESSQPLNSDRISSTSSEERSRKIPPSSEIERGNSVEQAVIGKATNQA